MPFLFICPYRKKIKIDEEKDFFSGQVLRWLSSRDIVADETPGRGCRLVHGMEMSMTIAAMLGVVVPTWIQADERWFCSTRSSPFPARVELHGRQCRVHTRFEVSLTLPMATRRAVTLCQLDQFCLYLPKLMETSDAR